MTAKLGVLLLAGAAMFVVAAGETAVDFEHFRLGFSEEYVCAGTVSDEPQRMHVRCRRAPARWMSCACTPGQLSAPRMACRCGSPTTAAGAPAALVPAIGSIEAARGLQEPG